MGDAWRGVIILLCSHSPNDVSIAAVRGAVRPSNFVL